jgi:CHAT domain-containing protein/lipopolysaccharide biosynthesis regulator YciM
VQLVSLAAQMVIADLHKIKLYSMQLGYKTKQFLIFLILLCFVLISTVSAQLLNGQSGREFDNGNYLKAIETAKNEIERSRKAKDYKALLTGLDVITRSQISLQKYNDAKSTLNEALQVLTRNEITASQKAQIYLILAWLWRAQYNSAKALEFGKKALAAAPNDRQVLGEYYLNIGRVLFSSGYDYSAIIWLEKAENIFKIEETNSAKLDTYRFLSLAWSSKLDYQKALGFSEKLISLGENTAFKFKYRQALFESSTILSITGQQQKTIAKLEKGLQLSIEQGNLFQGCLFLTSLVLNSLDENQVNKASEYLRKLERYNADNQFNFEIILGKAIISAFQGQSEASEKLFAQLEKMESSSEYLVPSWKLTIAERNKDWQKMIKLSEEILALTEKDNFRDGLPKIYLNFAKAYFELGQSQKSLEYLEKSISLVEEIRQSESSGLSLGILDTYHNAYRLLTQTKADKLKDSFELADFLKARLLKDRINNSANKAIPTISKEILQKLEALSLKYLEDQNVGSEIEKIEKSITAKMPELDLKKTDLSVLDNISDLDDSAVISYFFTLDKNLMVFVWEKGKSLRRVQLPISEDEVDQIAVKTQADIKNRVFFKRDGKAIYDKILAPLAISSKHLIIVPDKSLWKIPFQALSSDGEKYLIEERLISYAPSVAILLEQLKAPKPDRRTLQSFANSLFENRVLQNVNAEATTAAGIYNSQPIINATVNDFERISDKADILHFSMHAEVASDQPLDSFLGFRKFGKDDGHLTVEELLNIKLKKGSLVFLASCDTNTVLNGEGLVSLAWAMMASGATTVISSGWEANDKSTAIFTSNFYRFYRQGSSAAEAMQKASLELIKDKSGNMHEPYYWADFTLNGDFR